MLLVSQWYLRGQRIPTYWRRSSLAPTRRWRDRSSNDQGEWKEIRVRNVQPSSYASPRHVHKLGAVVRELACNTGGHTDNTVILLQRKYTSRQACMSMYCRGEADDEGWCGPLWSPAGWGWSCSRKI